VSFITQLQVSHGDLTSALTSLHCSTLSRRPQGVGQRQLLTYFGKVKVTQTNSMLISDDRRYILVQMRSRFTSTGQDKTIQHPKSGKMESISVRSH